jgi:hypothetical protein
MTDESGASAWASFSARHAAGDIVTVTVTKPLPFGCLVEATDGVPGRLRGVTGAHAGERLTPGSSPSIQTITGSPWSGPDRTARGCASAAAGVSPRSARVRRTPGQH